MLKLHKPSDKVDGIQARHRYEHEKLPTRRFPGHLLRVDGQYNQLKFAGFEDNQCLVDGELFRVYTNSPDLMMNVRLELRV